MQSSRNKILSHGDRVIGYTLVEPSSPSQTTIVCFYPLSGCSSMVTQIKVRLRCNLLCVDRPGCGSTSRINMKNTKRNVHLLRIETHIQDVMAVLQHYDIMDTIYSLGICLGHPYAVELALRVPVRGLTLVAPFVATQCSDSWWVARMGEASPHCLLQCCTNLAQAVAPTLTSYFLTPKALQKLMAKEETADEWTEQDYKVACEMVLDASQQMRYCQADEAQFGASSIWQGAVCDRFARHMGLFQQKEAQKHGEKPLRPTIRIHASPHDTLASLASIQWVADRCYGGQQVIRLQETIRSHELMTFFGGPPRDPVMLHEIAKEWGVYDDSS